MNPMMYISAATISLFFFAAAISSLSAAPVTVTNSFTAGNAAVAADVNQNFTDILTGINKMNPNGWTLTTNDIGYTGGRLGVGIASPTAKLTLSQTGATNADGLRIINGATTHHLFSDAGGRLTIGSTTTPAAMVIQDNGLVGIGTAAPGYLFTIKSNVASGIPMRVNNSSGNNAMSLSVDPTGNQLIIGDNAGTATAVIASSGDSYVMNKFGVGNSAPGATLDVTGSINGDYLMVTAARPGTLTGGRTYLVFGGSHPNSNLGNNSMTSLINSVGSGGNGGITFDRYLAASYVSTLGFFSPQGDLRIGGIVSGAGNANNGCLRSADATNIVGTCSSDRRLKREIVPLRASLSKIMALQPVSYFWNAASLQLEDRPRGQQIGLIAQDVQAVFPTLVIDGPDGYKKVSYGVELNMHMMQAIRELKSEKDTQVLALQRNAQQLEKRAAEAEQRYTAGLRQAQSEREVASRGKAAADARIVALEKRLNSELLARQQQDIRLAKLEQMLQRHVVARR